MRRPSTTRRRLLRSGAAAAGCGTLGSAAGCLDGFRPLSYRTWLPAPTASPAFTPGFEVLRPAVLVDRQDQFSPHVDFDEMDRVWAPATLEAGDATTFVHQDDVVVVEGPFERDATRAACEANGFASRGEYHGFSLLTAPGAGAGVAVGEDELVGVGLFMGAVEEPRPVLEAYVDARAGRVERWVESNEDLAALLDVFEDPHYLRAGLAGPTDTHDPENGRFRGRIGYGHGWSVRAGTLDGRWAIVTESPDAVDASDLRSWVNANRKRGDRFADWRDVTFETSGRVCVVTAVTDARNY